MIVTDLVRIARAETVTIMTRLIPARR